MSRPDRLASSIGWCARIALLSLALGGCTQIGTLNPGESVTITSARPLGSAESPQLELRNPVLHQDIRVGVGSGGVIGLGAGVAATSGLACGPYTPICIGVGMAAGMVVGLAAGSAAGLIETPARDHVNRLESKLKAFNEAHDMGEQLVAAVTSEAARRWTIVPDSRLVAIHVRVAELSLQLLRSDRASLRMLVKVRTEWAKGAERGTFDYMDFVHDGPPQAIADWLDADDEFIAGGVRTAYTDVAQRLCAVLAGEIPYVPVRR